MLEGPIPDVMDTAGAALMDGFDRPDLPIPDPPSSLLVLGQTAAPEPDRNGDVDAGRLVDHRSDPGDVEIDRLFAVGGLAGVHRLAQQVDVGVDKPAAVPESSAVP